MFPTSVLRRRIPMALSALSVLTPWRSLRCRSSAWRSAPALILCALMLGLASCAAPPPRGPAFAEMTFTHLSPIPLRVERVEITSRYIPPLEAPHVEHRLDLPPYGALRRWGEQRLVAAGGDHWAELVILDASITETALETTAGVRGLFRRDQAARYNGRVAALLSIRNPRGLEVAFVRAEAERSQTMAEGASLAAREAVWYEMTEAMMMEINRRLESAIAEHMSAHLAEGARLQRR